MKKLSVIFITLFLSVAYAPKSWAFVSPVSVSIVPPLQFPPSDFSVAGVRASVLWGHHRDVWGIDVGVLGNVTDQTFTGIAVSGIFNSTSGETTALGLQLAGLANFNTNKTKVIGLQAAALLNQNTAESSIVGLELALVNLSEHTTIWGFQTGLYNKAHTVYGFQIGLVNVAEDLHGIQIGLVNFHSHGIFAVSPIINIGF